MGRDLADLSTPTQPSTAYVDGLEQDIAAGVRDAAHQAAQQEDIKPSPRWQALATAGEQLRGPLSEIVADLHAHPETAFAEHRSARVLAQRLEEHGAKVQLGVYGVETAFETAWQSADFDPAHHPVIAIMAEYDALPGLGHACGHNIIAAAGVGAFLALRQELQARPVPGRVVLLGTPAEEGHTGKEYLIRGGALNGVDMAVMVHPFSYDVAEMAWVGRRSATVTFRGQAAHASAQPYMGRNALDAASLAYQGLGVLRQQMPPTDRLHAIISHGGDRPSIIPESATMELYVRSLQVETLMDLSQRVSDVISGAALMTGCGVELAWDPHPMSLPVRNNGPMARRWARTQALRGRIAVPAGTIPPSLAASTDFGNVSQLIPGLHPMIKVSPADIALHSQEFARWANSPQAYDAAVDAAVGLAQVTMDLLEDADLREQARADFDAAGSAVSVRELSAV